MVAKMRSVIVALDGPSGAGKSSIAREVARKERLCCLDTGAMFRSVAWIALRENVDLDDGDALGKIANEMDIRFVFEEGDPVASGVKVNGEDVTGAIRTYEIDNAVTPVCQHPSVRAALLEQQRRYCKSAGSWIVDGRDIGTVVFPDADVKIYLDAAPLTRAERRKTQNEETGCGSTDLCEVLEDILRRDKADMERENAPLCRAEDAVYINSSDMSKDEVVEIIRSLIHNARRA